MPPSRETSIEAGHFSPDTVEFIRRLHQFRVKFVMVGGEAVIFHGHVRFTGDVDFFYENSRENSAALFQALTAFWGGEIPGIKQMEEFLEPGIIVQFGRPPNRIDLLNRIDGVSFDEAWSTKLELSISDQETAIPLYMVSREKLIQNKRASARPKDSDDLRFLERAATDSPPSPQVG